MGFRILDSVENTFKIKKVVAVAAGKGGVGKSTISASLALASSLRGLKTGVLDADVYGPSIPILLPDTEKMGVQKDRIIPARSGNIQTVSMSHFHLTDSSTAFRAPVVNMFVQQCTNQVDWGELDVLYVDFPPGVGDVHLSLLQEWAFSGVVLVSLPNRLSQSDVEKAGRSFTEMGVEVLCVLENMASSTDPTRFRGLSFGQSSSKKLQEQFNAPFFETVPFDPLFAQTLDRGDNPFLQSRLTDAAKGILEIEANLIRYLEEKEPISPYPKVLEWSL
ncbi:MAG: Mrp/NBP35 family ATP-binding protein [Chlamydiae bacterium]|nr:Mrp/NBP35 family ATP-binding protein [Chlamydiota bacterium]